MVPAFWSMSRFEDFIDQCNLIDLGLTGYPFTWRNNREGEGHIQERLDRAPATPSWRTRYANAKVEHVDAVGSDHNVLLLHLNPGDLQRKPFFRFDARWVQEEELAAIIEKAWTTPTPGSRFFSVNKRIKECRCSMINWKKRKRFNSERNITELKDNIKSGQFERQQREPNAVCKQARAAWKEYKMVSDLTGYRPSPSIEYQPRWLTSPVDHLKINVDGALNPHSSIGGVGLVARDGTGLVVGAAMTSFKGSLSSRVIEALGFRFALTTALEQNWSSIIVEGDALQRHGNYIDGVNVFSEDSKERFVVSHHLWFCYVGDGCCFKGVN
ncbi:hypothetical protein Vadar_002091 [Vaccinium darrowii]|uniref:Uncharacterized protein n=1 Tax=Vaccinium darrowii TaxID=229202 RepID=A0ACB7ZHX9_9ERIC|nr:hypothetical protein Vadar_002091 [Vaccinium darrowii]